MASIDQLLTQAVDLTQLEDFQKVFADDEIKYFSKENYNIPDVVKHFLKSTNKEEPFYIIDIASILDQFTLWKTHLPRVHPFYTSKTSFEPKLLSVLDSLGLGFVISNQFELEKLLTLQKFPEVIYSSIQKKIKDLQSLKDKNIDLLTVSTTDELPRIKEHFPTARLILQTEISPIGAPSNFITKFPSSQEEIKEILVLGKSLGLNFIGMTCHINQNNDPSLYHQAISNAKEVFELAKTFGFNFNLLDLRSTLPGATNSTYKSFLLVADTINKALSDYFGDKPDLKIIAELGNFFAVRSAILVSQIIAQKKIKDGDRDVFQYYISEGTFGNLEGIAKDAALNVRSLREVEETYSSILLHPLGESANMILNNVELPRLEAEDWIYFLDSGSFTFTMFNPESNCFPEKRFYCAFIEENLKYLPIKE